MLNTIIHLLLPTYRWRAMRQRLLLNTNQISKPIQFLAMYLKNLKKVALSLLVFLSVVNGKAQYAPVNDGSSVQFKIKNFGIDVGGSLTGLQGKIKFDINKPAESNFDITVDAATVNTKNELRDNHLK